MVYSSRHQNSSEPDPRLYSASADYPGAGRCPDLQSLLWIGIPKCRVLADAYQTAVTLPETAATRVDLLDAISRPVSDTQLIVLCREDRHPIDHEIAEALYQSFPRVMWFDALGPLALGVRNRSCSSARSLPFHCLIDEIRSNWRLHLPNEKVIASQSVLLLAASERDSELYHAAVQGTDLNFSWSMPSTPSRFLNPDIYWWDDSVAEPADRLTWEDRIVSVDPKRKGQHLWICHSANREQEIAAISAGVTRVIRKPLLMNSLFWPGLGLAMPDRQGSRAA